MPRVKRISSPAPFPFQTTFMACSMITRFREKERVSPSIFPSSMATAPGIAELSRVPVSVSPAAWKTRMMVLSPCPWPPGALATHFPVTSAAQAAESIIDTATAVINILPFMRVSSLCGLDFA
jgi:hypothetical protein